MPTFDLGGKRAHVHDGGVAWRAERPWIVLVHGAGCTHVVWQPQSRALAHAGYNVLVPDLPGHGASEDDPSIRSVADYAAWLLKLHGAVERASGIPVAPLILVGHSLGACIAVSAAATWPASPAGLALVGASLEMKVNPSLLEDCLAQPARAKAFITALGHGRTTHLAGGTTPGAWTLGADAALLLAAEPRILQRDFAVCADWPGPALAPQVRCPTLVVSGALDRMTPAATGRKLAGAIPGARFELLPGVGHFLPTEAPRPLLMLLRAFAGQVTASRAA
jgi:pimeloyl-ACP methyl ester carboxylesterase